MDNAAKKDSKRRKIVRKEKENLVLIKEINDLFLIGENVVFTNEVKYSAHPTTGTLTQIGKRRLGSESSPVSFKLAEISLPELFKIRKEKLSGVLLKNCNDYFFTKLPSHTYFTDSFFWSAHLCGYCKNFSAAEWGCPKVQDTKLHLENYDFIDTGLEAVNLTDNTFFVCRCLNHIKENG